MPDPTIKYITPSNDIDYDGDVPVYVRRSRLRTIRRSGVAWLVRGIWVGVTVSYRGAGSSFVAFRKMVMLDGARRDRIITYASADASSLLDVQVEKIASGGFEPGCVLRDVERELSMLSTYADSTCPEGIPYMIHALDAGPREIAYQAFRENRV